MRRVLLLLFFFLLALALAARGMAQASDKTTKPEDILPAKVNAKVIVFDTDGLRCVMYVSESGFTAGYAATQCSTSPALLPSIDFRIIRVVKTQGK